MPGRALLFYDPDQGYVSAEEEQRELAAFRELFSDTSIAPGDTPLDRAKELRRVTQLYASTGTWPKWAPKQSEGAR